MTFLDSIIDLLVSDDSDKDDLGMKLMLDVPTKRYVIRSNNVVVSVKDLEAIVDLCDNRVI